MSTNDTPPTDARALDTQFLTPDECRLLETIVSFLVRQAPSEEPKTAIVYQGNELEIYREGQASILWMLKKQLREAFPAAPQPPPSAPADGAEGTRDDRGGM